jgi:hypothetical protein
LEPALRHSVTIKDERGELSKFFLDIDFIPREFFIIRDVPLGGLRGQHAHFKCEQLIMLLKGKLNVSLESKISNETVLLNIPGSFVLIPALTWSKQEYLSFNTEIIVFCSEEFDEKDYIRDYQDFQKLV